MGLGAGGTQVRKRGLAVRFSQAGGEAVSPILWVTEKRGCEARTLLTSQGCAAWENCSSFLPVFPHPCPCCPMVPGFTGLVCLPLSTAAPVLIQSVVWQYLDFRHRVVLRRLWALAPWPQGQASRSFSGREEKFPIRWLRNVLEWREEKPPSQDAVCSGERAADCTGPCGVCGQLPDSAVGGTGVGPPAWVLSPDLTVSSLSFLQSLKLASALEKDLDTFQNKVERNLQGGRKNKQA